MPSVGRMLPRLRVGLVSEKPTAATTADGHRTLSYRPHLDGVRSIAVLMVFVFHASPGALRGGFIGVDVFFVLSGYLITRILLSQPSGNAGRVLASFYSRRIKRLLPAALVLVLAVAVHDALWGSVLDLEQRLGEIRATVLYVANCHLIDQADAYFVDSATASPLRHMWSLAVEEQFYVVWPIVIVVALRFGRARVRWVAVAGTGLAIASVVAMIVTYTPVNVARAYYGTDARVFQPLLGALLAVAVIGRPRRETPTGALSRAPITAIGVGALVSILIIARLIEGTDAVYFPWGALAVAVASCALILALENSPALASVFGIRPLAALGRISYGFYLWHWPVIVWLRPPASANSFERGVFVGYQFAITLALATASFVLVERPVRLTRPSRDSITAFGSAAIAMALVFTSAGLLLKPASGADAAIAADAVEDQGRVPCPHDPRPCVMFDPGDPSAPTVVTIGDSTMQHYHSAMMVLAEQYGLRYVQAAVGGCPISGRLLATGTDGAQHRPRDFKCFADQRGIYAEVLDTWDPELIIGTALHERLSHVTDGELVVTGTPRHTAELTAALNESLDTLTGRGATFVFLALLPKGPSVDCLESSPPTGGDCVTAFENPRREAGVNALFADLAAARDDVAGVIDVVDVVCPGDRCPLSIDGVVARFDGGHFTSTFSARLAPVLDDRLRALGVDLGTM